MGLSPDITLILTSFSLNHLIVSIASSLTLSEIIIKPIAEKVVGVKSLAKYSFECAKTKTLAPSSAYESILSLMSA